MKSRSWILLLLLIAGIIILLLPENGSRIIELNEKHGPSAFDLLGLTLIMITWGFSCYLIFRNRERIVGRFGKTNVLLLLALYLVSAACIVLGLVLSSEGLLWSCVIMAMVINIAFFVAAITTANK